MKDFRVGYFYSLAPIHCGGEGDLGNILDIAREAHTSFPYVPGSSLRGSLRDEAQQCGGKPLADRLFGKELSGSEQMGVHQVWFGDARLLWVPMRTLSMQGKDVFMWVSCHSLIRDHALVSKQPKARFPDHPVGSKAGRYMVADAELEVQTFSHEQQQALQLAGHWSNDLGEPTKTAWEKSCIVLPDSDFQVLMEHSLWTQVRNKIQEETGSAEVFWTDVCIPRDTIFYYAWGYSLQKQDPVTIADHTVLKMILSGLIQVGGQANVGRGWAQSWIGDKSEPKNPFTEDVKTAAVEA